MAAVIKKPPSLLKLAAAEIPCGTCSFEGYGNSGGTWLSQRIPVDSGRVKFFIISLTEQIFAVQIVAAKNCFGRERVKHFLKICGLPRLAGRAGIVLVLQSGLLQAL
jgi:hypothetical protein